MINTMNPLTLVSLCAVAFVFGWLLTQIPAAFRRFVAYMDANYGEGLDANDGEEWE